MESYKSPQELNAKRNQRVNVHTVKPQEREEIGLLHEAQCFLYFQFPKQKRVLLQ